MQSAMRVRRRHYRGGRWRIADGRPGQRARSTSVNRPSARSSSGTAARVHVVVLDADHPAGPQQGGGAGDHRADHGQAVRRRRTPPRPGRGRPPPAARRCRPARTAGCTAPRRPAPRRSGEQVRVGDVACDHLDAGVAGGVAAQPAPARPATAPPRSPGAGRHLVRDRQRDRARCRCTGRPPSRRGAVLRRSPSRPAARSPAAGTNTPSPTASSRWRKAAVPSRCCNGIRSRAPARPARRTAGARRRSERVDQRQPARGHPEHVRGQQLGVGARRLDAGRGQVRSGHGQHRSQRRPFRRIRGVFVGAVSRHNHETSCVTATGRVAGSGARERRGRRLLSWLDQLADHVEELRQAGQLQQGGRSAEALPILDRVLAATDRPDHPRRTRWCSASAP